MKFKIIPNEQTPKAIIIKPIEILLKEDYELLVKFLSFARNQYDCAGLASNQCSVGTKRYQERITIPFFALKENYTWDIIIYPIIIDSFGKVEIKKEGCLTWKGKTVIAERYHSIQVEYFNLKGELINKVISGFEAQVFQHEYNHLQGIEEKFE